MDKTQGTGISIKTGLAFVWLQEVRLVAALMESGYRVILDKEHDRKFRILKKKFGFNYGISGRKDRFFDLEINLSHAEPFVRIGGIKRPLLFPRAMFCHLKKRWPSRREHDISFMGLLTDKRAGFFRDFLGRFENVKETRTIPEKAVDFFNLFPGRRGNVPETHRYESGKYSFFLVWSERGRQFPVKSWDERYYKLLLNSRFVLCPEGDYRWSYRFFEAILCGAIPVVESYHPAYEGFSFRTMEDLEKGFAWDADQAERNFRLCYDSLTVPAEDLNREISRLYEEFRVSDD